MYHWCSISLITIDKFCLINITISLIILSNSVCYKHIPLYKIKDVNSPKAPLHESFCLTDFLHPSRKLNSILFFFFADVALIYFNSTEGPVVQMTNQSPRPCDTQSIQLKCQSGSLSVLSAVTGIVSFCLSGA